MARLLTQTDIYAIMNNLVEDLTGQQNNTRVVDTSTFASAGETVLSYSTENVMNSLSMLLGRIMIAVRPYGGKFNLINQTGTGLFTHRLAKISYYSKGALPEGAWNTQLFTNIHDSFTNGQNLDANDQPQSVKSMWEQNLAVPLEMFFGGSDVWEYCITIPEVQIQQAFRDPESFNEFVSGYLTTHENQIQIGLEAFRRSAVLNHIAGVYDLSSDMPGSVVNLTEEFNTLYYGSDTTSYKTSAELRSTYLKEFLAFMVYYIKNDIKKMENLSSKFHWTPTKLDASNNQLPLLRHTPRTKQKLFLYQPLFLQAETMVLPEIFNDRYLSVGNYEGVEFWQNENNPSEINITPGIPATSGQYEGTQVKGAAVNLDYVVGCLFDEDALMVDNQMRRADTTPVEARKLYRNIWDHIAMNIMDDFTEKSIIYIMADPT